MPSPEEQMRELAGFDQQHQEAMEAFGEAWSAMLQKSLTERLVAVDRQAAYEQAFKYGFVLEEVLDLEGVEYGFGYHYVASGDPYVGTEKVELYDNIDAEHAAALAGRYANPHGRSPVTLLNKYGREPARPWSEELPPANLGVRIEFTVAGFHRNETHPDPDEYVDNPEDLFPYEDWNQPTVTTYHAVLEAVKWRLPTTAEIAELGSKETNLDLLANMQQR